jgi:O-acetyl-ADP-ribose deacetylase (regulator of RNase III)
VTTELRIGERVIELRLGDITTFQADAIVNAANSSLAGGGGVDGAIHRAGGPEVMRDLERRYGRNRHCPTGSAVPSDAGDLPARWVIHAVGPVWHGGIGGEQDLLRSAYETSFRVARELGARSVTVPSISTGIYRFPVDLAAPIAVGAARDHLTGETTLERIAFVLFSQETFAAFDRALTDLGRGGGSAEPRT